MTAGTRNIQKLCLIGHGTGPSARLVNTVKVLRHDFWFRMTHGDTPVGQPFWYALDFIVDRRPVSGSTATAAEIYGSSSASADGLPNIDNLTRFSFLKRYYYDPSPTVGTYNGMNDIFESRTTYLEDQISLNFVMGFAGVFNSQVENDLLVMFSWQGSPITFDYNGRTYYRE